MADVSRYSPVLVAGKSVAPLPTWGNRGEEHDSRIDTQTPSSKFTLLSAYQSQREEQIRQDECDCRKPCQDRAGSGPIHPPRWR